MTKKTFILFFGVLLMGLPTQANNDVQKTVYGLIERITPGYASQYELELIEQTEGKDVYEIEGNGRKIILRGNNAVSLASAFNWYLKYTCNAHVSWFGNQLNLPDILPQPADKQRIVIEPKYRVYLNYCTVSYTAAWWNWERWQKELDYMAMNGINMPLFSLGLYEIWYNTLMRFNFTDLEARTFLSLPGHAAWQWMQNIHSEGGPLPTSTMKRQTQLAKQVLSRMLEFNMQPIQQGFSGFVPPLLKQKRPEAKIDMTKAWYGFAPSALVNPSDPLFVEFGKAFLEEQDKLFGSYGVYAADPFHERKPPVETSEYLHAVGVTINKLFQQFDKGCIWAMQSWSLREDIVKAVPRENLLILDLAGKRVRRDQGFWGYPTVIGNLHNFGGRINMHGDLHLLAANQYQDIKKVYPNVCGDGLFMEAVEQNPVYYDLAFEMFHRTDKVNIHTWLQQYAQRRYGARTVNTDQAMRLLLEGPYRRNTTGTARSSIVAARPALNVKKSGPNAGLGIPYDPLILFKAERLLLADAELLKHSKPYRFDVVDVMRQIMTNIGQPIHKKAAEAFEAKDKTAFTLHSGRFLQMLEDMDELLRTRPEYSFDRWLTEARSWGETKAEKDLMEQDATTLLTVWGAQEGNDPGIFDYAWREWSGLINGFYKVRWQKFYSMLQKHLDEGTGYSEEGLKLSHGRESFRANDFYISLGDWELDYTRQVNKARTPITQGDEIEIAKRLFRKYEKLSAAYYQTKVSNADIIKTEKTYENLGE